VAVLLTDEEIQERLGEKKVLPPDHHTKIALRAKRGHKEREIDMKGQNGGEYRLILRQSSHNALDFSAILAYRMPDSTQLFRLRRCNGRSHQHTNLVEHETIEGFHIHEATQRYQEAGYPEDGFAESTDRFADLESATSCLLADCGVVATPPGQGKLFGDQP
jgi:hypothetical protein